VRRFLHRFGCEVRLFLGLLQKFDSAPIVANIFAVWVMSETEAPRRSEARYRVVGSAILFVASFLTCIVVSPSD
jgi:hypothetical protein